MDRPFTELCPHHPVPFCPPPPSDSFGFCPQFFASLGTTSRPRWFLSVIVATLMSLYCPKPPSERGPYVLLPRPTCPQHGEVLPLKIVTYAAVSLSLTALLVAFVLLTLVRTLRSNLHGIHRNLIGALFFSQLVFVIGITQTGNPVRPLCPFSLRVPPFSEAGARNSRRSEGKWPQRRR